MFTEGDGMFQPHIFRSREPDYRAEVFTWRRHNPLDVMLQDNYVPTPIKWIDLITMNYLLKTYYVHALGNTKQQQQ